MQQYIAMDLGAESGRVVLGTLAGRRLELEVVHRFPNAPVPIGGTLRWDVLRIFAELRAGLQKAGARARAVASLSCDSWGVDYVWLRGREPFLTAPFHYRDARTEDGFARAFAVVAREKIFAETGIQFMSLNTLYQLHDDARRRPWVFPAADGFLNIGDYFNYLFSGVAKAEVSLASTTQLYNPRRKDWSRVLLRKLGLPKKLFPKIVPAGTVLGPLTPEIAAETGLSGARVIATCSHDTGAAVAAVPAKGNRWAYLSSGTWSLLGVELPKPVINDRCRELNFTNEVGYGNTIRLLKNISGLWLVQECRRAWATAGREYSYDELTRLAEAAPPLRVLINPNDSRFARPNHLPEKIAEFCRETRQQPPQTDGAFIRCVFESLALLYRRTLEQVEILANRKIATLHIVGGGSQNRLLNQLSANATGRTVVAGPVEATAVGNILVQALALGQLASLAELRGVVRRSFALETFRPRDATAWAAAYERFQNIAG